MLSFALMLLALPALAQQPVVSLSLDSCKAMAYRNQARVRNAGLAVQAARETRRAAFTKYFPTLSVAAGAFKSSQYLIDVDNSDLHENDNARLDIEASFDGQPLDSRLNQLEQQLALVGVNVDLQEEINAILDHFAIDAHLQMFDHGLFASALLVQPVFVGGRIINGNRLAKLGVDAAELQLLMTRDEVELSVEESYWLIASLREKSAMVCQVRQMLDSLERDASAACEAGVMGRNDLLKVRLKQREMDASRAQLDHGLSLALMSLCQQVGLAYSDTVVYLLSDSLPAHPQQLLPALSGKGSLDDAVRARNESKLLELAVESERLKRLMAMGDALPQISVGATYGVNTLKGTLSDNGILFASVNVPITSWWETAHNMRKQELARQQALNNMEDMSQKMLLQTRQVLNAETEALELLSIRQQAVKDAQDNLVESRNYFEAGMLGVSDYLEAQALLSQARSELIDQQVRLRMAQLKRQQLVRESSGR